MVTPKKRPVANPTESASITPTRVLEFSIEPTLRVQLFEFGSDHLDRFAMVRITARTGAGTWSQLVLKPVQWQALYRALADIHTDQWPMPHDP